MLFPVVLDRDEERKKKVGIIPAFNRLITAGDGVIRNSYDCKPVNTNDNFANKLIKLIKN